MKVEAVSALRSKRGLHRVNGAEPPVVGLTPQTTDERKTDTMKPYILRDSQPVEVQKSLRPPRSKPAAPETHDERKVIEENFPVIMAGNGKPSGLHGSGRGTETRAMVPTIDLSWGAECQASQTL